MNPDPPVPTLISLLKLKSTLKQANDDKKNAIPKILLNEDDTFSIVCPKSSYSVEEVRTAIDYVLEQLKPIKEKQNGGGFFTKTKKRKKARGKSKKKNRNHKRKRCKKGRFYLGGADPAAPKNTISDILNYAAMPFTYVCNLGNLNVCLLYIILLISVGCCALRLAIACCNRQQCRERSRNRVHRIIPVQEVDPNPTAIAIAEETGNHEPIRQDLLEMALRLIEVNVEQQGDDIIIHVHHGDIPLATLVPDP